MPRKLPWLVNPEVKSQSPAQRPAPHRQRAPSVLLANEEHKPKSKPHPTTSPVRSRSRKHGFSRTPSTSPPPAPPGVEYMHEGYDRDDIYIMVEDEFQAVAQSFTKLLHHAEYMRMKKKARENPPNTETKVTDQVSTEIKRKLRARALHGKQVGAVKTMTGEVVSGSEEDVKDDDPWVGTTLAGLMTTDGSKQRTALLGLEKIPSSTRAAQGFGRGESDSPGKRRGKKGVLDIYGIGEKEHAQGIDEHEEAPEDDGGCLNIDAAASSRLPDGKAGINESRSSSFRKASSPIEFPAAKGKLRKFSTANKPSIPGSSSTVKFTSRFNGKAIDLFDDGFNQPKPPLSPSSIGARKDTRRRGRSIDRDKDKRSRQNEIPTFLVR